MAEKALPDPFGGKVMREVPLTDPPLVRVLAQVRFPTLSVLTTDDAAAHAFAARVRSRYPVLNRSQEKTYTITPEGISSHPSETRRWHLQSADSNWGVSFGESFLALDSNQYRSREDFVGRFAEVWEAFAECAEPPFVERVGVRYINVLDDPERLAELDKLVRPELQGTRALPGEGAKLVHSVNEEHYQLGPHQRLQVRWGFPPHGTILDASLPPISRASWVLDIDAFAVGRSTADSTALSGRLTALAEIAYRYFRWSVTNDFLSRYGGEVP